ncbi:hypothetical protein D3C81_288090 [compost metagenome]
MTPIQVKLERLEARRAAFYKLPYCDHISFFFSPIPAFLLPKIFPADHPVWKKGTKLYEHVVDTATLPMTIEYMVVESVKRTALYDQFVKDHNWHQDDPKLLEEWFLWEDEHLRRWEEKGNRRNVLERKIHENMYSTSSSFLAASRREDREENEYKYASCVPHLMLYPPEGRVAPQEINSLIMGNDTRTLVIPSTAL